MCIIIFYLKKTVHNVDLIIIKYIIVYSCIIIITIFLLFYLSHGNIGQHWVGL